MTRVTAAALALAFAIVSVAAAEGSPRDEYKEKVEPICKTDKSASKRILTGVEKLVRHNKLKPAGQRFSRAAAALQKAERQLAAVPQPPEDSARLRRWLSGIKGEVSLMRRIAAKFKHGNKSKGSSLVVKLKNNAKKTNNLVIVYQFRYCKIDPSEFK
jgi:hypothetical protein